MSAIIFRMTAKGNLPHLSYIFRKPEPMGVEFKTVAWSVTSSLLFIEVRRVKEGVNNSKYYHQLGATASCTKRTRIEKKGIVQR